MASTVNSTLINGHFSFDEGWALSTETGSFARAQQLSLLLLETVSSLSTALHHGRTPRVLFIESNTRSQGYSQASQTCKRCLTLESTILIESAFSQYMALKKLSPPYIGTLVCKGLPRLSAYHINAAFVITSPLSNIDDMSAVSTTL